MTVYRVTAPEAARDLEGPELFHDLCNIVLRFMSKCQFAQNIKGTAFAHKLEHLNEPALSVSL